MYDSIDQVLREIAVEIESSKLENSGIFFNYAVLDEDTDEITSDEE